MTTTEDRLKTIEEDAFIAMTPSEIAWDIGMKVEEFKAALCDEKSDINNAYRTGQVKAVKLAKDQIKEQAKIGNPTALEQFLHNITDMIGDEY